MINKIGMTSLGYGFYPTHPGKMLRDELEARGISQRKSVNGIGMSYSVLNEILSGHHSLSATTALMFGTALGAPAESLMRLQLKYNMQTARTDRTLVDKLREIARAAALLW